MHFKIKELREQKGWTQEKLANKSNVSRNLIARLESGSLDKTSTDTLFKLAKALEVKVESIFFENSV